MVLLVVFVYNLDEIDFDFEEEEILVVFVQNFDEIDFDFDEEEIFVGLFISLVFIIIILFKF